MCSLGAGPVLRERLEGQTAYAGLSALRDACAIMLSTLPRPFIAQAPQGERNLFLESHGFILLRARSRIVGEP
jgi:hypothetical protein